MNKLTTVVIGALLVLLTACGESKITQSERDAEMASQQQSQYAKSQPVPQYEWSLERHLLIQLYNARNTRAATHSVWRSDYGTVEGDCSSIGFGLPYDTSLTNPLVATDVSKQGRVHTYQGGSLTSIEQAEPNGIFASKNTSATWVLCTGEFGNIEPVYVESKVSVYPYPISVDYNNGRVVKLGKASVSISNK